MTGATWHRNAGSRTYHLDAPDWVRSGRAVCGADTSHPYVASHAPIDGVFVQLADYPRRYGRHGQAFRCKRCVRASEVRP